MKEKPNYAVVIKDFLESDPHDDDGSNNQNLEDCQTCDGQGTHGTGQSGIGDVYCEDCGGSGKRRRTDIF